MDPTHRRSGRGSRSRNSIPLTTANALAPVRGDRLEDLNRAVTDAIAGVRHIIARLQSIETVSPDEANELNGRVLGVMNSTPHLTSEYLAALQELQTALRDASLAPDAGPLVQLNMARDETPGYLRIAQGLAAPAEIRREQERRTRRLEERYARMARQRREMRRRERMERARRERNCNTDSMRIRMEERREDEEEMNELWGERVELSWQGVEMMREAGWEVPRDGVFYVRRV